MSKVDILGVQVDSLTKRDVIERARQFLDGDRPCLITTTYSEFIVRAQKDEEFKNAYDNSSYKGVSEGYWFKNEKIQPNNTKCPGEGKIVLYKQKPYSSSLDSKIASRLAFTPAPPPSAVVCVDIYTENVVNLAN